MDPDIGHWILEYLLRSSVPDSIVKKIFKVLQVSVVDSRLEKTLILRSIQSEVARVSITETLLECLEIIEEIDKVGGIAITQAMKQAYCAVAVECTVRYLEACPVNNTCSLFDDAVNRIWRGRVRQMMEAAASEKRSHLFTDELIEWKDVIESAREDPVVCERLANTNTRRTALNKLRAYLEETWASMGPSFLELVAILSEENSDKIGDVRGEVAINTPNEGCDKGVSESNGIALDNDACKEKAPAAGGNRDGEQLGKRSVSSVGGNQALGGIELPPKIERAIQKGKLPLKHNYAAARTHRGVKILDAEKVGPTTMSSEYDHASSVQVKKLRESLKSSSFELQALVKDPLPDALHKSDIVRSELTIKGMNFEPPYEDQSANVDVPERNTCRTMVLYQPIDDILKKQSSVNVNRSNAQRPRLMERNSTAHTYEWDDSIDNLHGGTPRKRRRNIRWSSVEEDTLRAGVKKFGKGNWKSILKFYSEIFTKTGRTEVDLKDKWRNMTR